MSRWSLAVLLVMVCGSMALATAPTDNPIAAKYGNSAYPWANQIKWDAIFDVTSYGGVGDGVTDNLAAFNAARDAAVAAGGGVVYFPAGTYKFSDSLQVKSGVVVRGDNPTGITDAKTTGYAPPTKFEFPQYVPTFSGSGTDNSTAFKSITAYDNNNDSNLGIVNVDVNRAGIKFGAVNKGIVQYGTGYTDVSLDARMKNVIVFGVRSNNVAETDPSALNTKLNAWQRYSYRFTANVLVQPWRNAIVSNNRVNDNVTDNYFQPGYIAIKGSGTTVLNGTTYSTSVGFAEFSYTDHYGIAAGRIGVPASGSDPVSDPARFRPGIALNDNYVYATMRVKLYGGGYGIQMKDNVLTDKVGKVIWLDANGQKYQTNNSATYENRAIDVSGYDAVVSGNNYNVQRHTITNSGYPSVDGEGILMQESSGTLAVGEQILNNTGNAYISLYKTKEIRDCLIEGNTVTAGEIYVQSNTNSTAFPTYNTIVRNNTVSSGIRFISGKYYSGYDGNEVTGNGGSGTIQYTTPDVYVHDNTLATGTTTASTAANRGPNVAITSPTWMQSVGATTATITASASDADGTISKVEFYNQKTLIGTDSDGSDGWSVSFSGLTYGAEYMIEAKAYDNSSSTWVADPVFFASRMGGDCNLDRYVDVVDLGLLATSYGKSIGGQWQLGDFNEDGVVDVIDLGILATNYGNAVSGLDAGTIPEPATMTLLGIGLAGLLRRRN